MTGNLRDAEAALETEGPLFDELQQPAQLWQVYSSRARCSLSRRAG